MKVTASWVAGAAVALTAILIAGPSSTAENSTSVSKPASSGPKRRDGAATGARPGGLIRPIAR